MSRKYFVPVLLIVQVVVFLLLASVFIQQPAVSASGADAPQAKPQEQIAANGLYLWSYAAKFVCGLQAPLAQGAVGEPVVKPGNYATDINIHNPAYRLTLLRKKFLVLVENGEAIAAEPQSTTEPRRIITMTLSADMATMDDCNTLWKYIYPTGLPGGRPLTVGYLVILSPVDLDVDVVYTAAAPGDVAAVQQSLSIDVERVTGKRIFVPAGALP
jgi:hypothetical protein